MKHHLTTLISLGDTYQFLRVSYREYAMRALNAHRGVGAIPFSSVEFDPTEFLVAVVHEIAHTDETASQLGQPSVATNLLIKAGLDRHTAVYLAHETYRQITDLIGVYAPHACFGPYENGWHCEYVHPFDLAISQPIQSTDETPREFPTIADEIAASRNGVEHYDPRLQTNYNQPAAHWFQRPGPAGVLWHLDAEDSTLPRLTSRDIDNLSGGLPPDA